MSTTHLTPRGSFVAMVAAVVIVAGVIAGIVRATDAPASTAPRSTALQPTEMFVRTTCADLVVLGLRGSGQSVSASQGVGAEVLSSVRAMATRLHDNRQGDGSLPATVRLEAVLFPARYAPTLAAYETGIRTGEAMIRARLADLSSRCRNSRFALVGFSQGANVVHAYADGLSATQARRLAFVAMIADPFKNPADTIRSYSYSTVTPGPGKYGIGPLFDRATRNKAITFCVRMDEICNRPADGGPTEISLTHRTFYEQPGSARQTGRELLRMLTLNLA